MNTADYQRYESLRLVTFSCHEAALRRLAHPLRTCKNVKRYHLLQFFLKEPIRRKDTRTNAHDCFVPFIDREVSARGFVLSVPQTEDDKTRLCSQLYDSLSEGESPVALPLVPAGGTEEYVAATALSNHGPIETRNGGAGILDRWYQNKDLGYCFHKRQNSKDFRDELAGVLSNSKLDINHKMAHVNVFGPLGLYLLSPLSAGGQKRPVVGG